MDALYPNLHDKFKIEGVCPICLMEMELAPRYSCANGHTFCYRCKPFFYDCPTCRSSLNIVTPPRESNSSHTPPLSHFLPHPVVPPVVQPPYPSAPPMDNEHREFLDHERRHWGPPEPPKDVQLVPCAYKHLGCWINVPPYLRTLHESRCQFRPHMEEEMLPTDLPHNPNELVECRHHIVGCKVRMPVWRRHIHEGACNYKEKFQAMNDVIESIGCVTIDDSDHRHNRLQGDPEELVECKYKKYGCTVRMARRIKFTHEERCNYSEYHQADDDDEIVWHSSDPEELVECKYKKYGCTVRMPRRIKFTHEERCNYNKYHQADGDKEIVWHSSDPEFDPDEQVDCRWAEYGCPARPKLYRKSTHEENCNYRMEECSYKDYGCDAIFEPPRKYAHEKFCSYAP